MARAEQAERKQNIYNRQSGKARVLIGDWAEERMVYEMKEKLGMDPERRDEGAKACLTDFRISPETLYSTCNREYGIPVETVDESYKKTLCPAEIKERPKTITPDYKEERIEDQHRSHNFFGVTQQTKVNAETTTAATFRQLDEHPEDFAPWDFMQPVNLHRVQIKKVE